jgi:fructose-specific component phosphotransferase system IIB-like protein
MATYTDANGVKLITTGDEAGTWGSSTNVNLQILDRAANGFESIALSSTTYTLALSAQPSSAEDGHYKAINFTGSPGGTCTVTLDQNDKARVYMILNSTDAALIITQGSGGNVTIEVGKGSIVLADGAGSGAAVTDFTAAVQNVTDLSSPFNVGATSVTTSGAELNLLDGSAAGAINNSKAVIYGSSGEVNATTLQISGTSITATAAELNYVDGVTSAIQTQINGKQATITGAATTIDDTDLTASRAVISNASGKVAVSGVTTTELDILDGLTASTAELNIMDGVTASTAELNIMDGVTATTAELNYVDGVTSDIQTQLGGKQATITGAATTIDDTDLTASRAVISNASGKVAVSAVTDTELGYVSGVTSAIQTQINSKQATITGAATTIDDANLTASRVLVSNSSGKVAVSSTTTTELGNFIDGSSLNASNLDSGTVNDARLPASISSDITGNAATATTAAALTGDATRSGDFTVDASGNIVLDADNNGGISNFKFKNGTGGGTFNMAFDNSENMVFSGTQELRISTGQDLILDSNGGQIYFRSGNVTRGFLDVQTANTLDFHAGSSVTETLKITTSGVNVVQGLRVGDTTAPTDNDIYAAADIEAGADLKASGEIKLTGGAQDWTFEVDGSNRLVIQYNGTSLARIDTSGNLVVAGDITTNGTL